MVQHDAHVFDWALEQIEAELSEVTLVILNLVADR